MRKHCSFLRKVIKEIIKKEKTTSGRVNLLGTFFIYFICLLAALRFTSNIFLETLYSTVICTFIFFLSAALSDILTKLEKLIRHKGKKIRDRK